MVPTKIKLHKDDGTLSLEYADGSHFTLTGEYLRIHSPSAEVRGHGKGQEILQHGKKDIKITGLEPSGNYALQITFSDEHDSGIYSWDYLYDLATNHNKYWQNYLTVLNEAGKRREAGVQVVQFMEPK